MATVVECIIILFYFFLCRKKCDHRWVKTSIIEIKLPRVFPCSKVLFQQFVSTRLLLKYWDHSCRTGWFDSLKTMQTWVNKCERCWHTKNKKQKTKKKTPHPTLCDTSSCYQRKPAGYQFGYIVATSSKCKDLCFSHANKITWSLWCLWTISIYPRVLRWTLWDTYWSQEFMLRYDTQIWATVK